MRYTEEYHVGMRPLDPSASTVCKPKECRLISEEKKDANSLCENRGKFQAWHTQGHTNGGYPCYEELHHDITDCKNITTGGTCTVTCKAGYNFKY